jgi:hypothetical protein
MERFCSAIDAAVAHLVSNGNTMVHHMGTWDDYFALHRANAVRISMATTTTTTTTSSSSSAFLRLPMLTGARACAYRPVACFFEYRRRCR